MVTMIPKPVAEGLSNEEILRYSRHLIMPEVGMEGQLKLKAAKVDRKSTRLNSSHIQKSRMPSSA